MPLEVGIVGLPGSGKTTLFNVLTQAGAELRGGKENVGMAAIPDGRLSQVAAVVPSKKATPAAIRVVDVPGTGPAQLGNLRQVDAIVAVVDGFSPGADPAAGLEDLQLELLVADRDHVEKRLERVRKQAKSGEAAVKREAADLEALLAHLEGGGTIAEYAGTVPGALEPLTAKPVLAVENGPGGIDLKLEAELAELPEEEAAAFRDGESALDEVVGRLKQTLDLIVFFTANENDARAWTLRHGKTALDAAATVHSDLARGFIRCEVIRWDDLMRYGSAAEAARHGRQRLEGKGYVVEDGDVLNIRFNV